LPQDPEGDSFHATAHQRKTASLDFVSDLTLAGQALGTSCVACLPIDRLSNRLQHLDHRGGGFSELTDASPKGLVNATLHHFWELMNPWYDSDHSSHLDSMWWHLEGMGINRDSAIDQSRATCVGLAASVLSRLQLKYS
jgi:hypothetical protein